MKNLPSGKGMSPPVYPGGVESWPVPEELVGVLDVCPVKKNGFFLKKCLRNSINYPWPLRGGGGGGVECFGGSSIFQELPGLNSNRGYWSNL